ncbi:hypothetical protein V5G24_10025 [Xanthobacter sp. VTT E-85241]|uniref:hypothetical protein n=1 Tax=Roseixanthobacter finlandensis TaxID=3119922 RepID=UPI00372AD9CC
MKATFSFRGSLVDATNAHVIDRMGHLHPELGERDEALFLVACERDQRITAKQFLTLAKLASQCSEYELCGELVAHGGAIKAVQIAMAGH